MQIDLHADAGEGFGAWSLGEDETLIPLVSSVNVACGFHAGDPRTIERAVALAVAAGTAVGAHPGYPDLVGFGRRELAMSPDDLEAAVVYQVGAVAAFARDAGTVLRHVKPHGALYNRAAVDRVTADAVARAVRRVSPTLILVGLAGSALIAAGAQAGLSTAGEAFPDRAYESDGTLRARRHPDSLIVDPAVVAARAIAFARDGAVTTVDGGSLAINAATLCIHGDTPGATDRARAIRGALEAAGITIRPLASVTAR
jgi:UPF0271 protein